MNFTKLEATGNDFILLDFTSPARFESHFISLNDAEKMTFYQKMADRHFGIGADQILILTQGTYSQSFDTLSAESPSSYNVRFINADGSESEMCGNALRAVGHYLREERKNLSPKLFLKTLAGEQELNFKSGEWISTMIIPDVSLEDESLNAFDRKISFRRVSMGNPHAVFFNLFLNNGPSPDELKTVGSFVENHPLFPNRSNVEFVNIISRDEINVKVWERGAGATLSCGSGACAAVVAGIKKGLLDRLVKVNMPGGVLQVNWTSDDEPALLSGSVSITFKGEYPF